jgi:DNA-binding NtrC family response regulator
MGKGDLRLSRDTCDLLRPHLWPGNIRGLQNATERYNIDVVPDELPSSTTRRRLLAHSSRRVRVHKIEGQAPHARPASL